MDDIMKTVNPPSAGRTGAAAEVFGALGTLSHYNGLLFGDMTATQADCEGALAVGGTAKFGAGSHGYDIGGAGLPNTASVMIGSYSNPNGYPTLLLGGTVSGESTSANVYAGALALRSGYRQEYEAGPFQFSADSLCYEEDALIASFFQTARKKSRNTAGVLLDASNKRISAAQLRDLCALDHSQYRGDLRTDKRVQVYTLDCGEDEAVTVGEIDFDSFVGDCDMVVINLPARSVTFTGGAILYEGAIVNTSLPRIYEGNKVVALLANRVVFNLPNAREVFLNNYGITGSILAPEAAVSGNGGSVNGMLVADSLVQNGGMELHAFTIAMAELLWELAPDGPYGEVTLQKRGDDGADLEDAVFSLFQYNPQTGGSQWITDGTTDPDGELIFYDLEPGWYRITETRSPPGYVRGETSEWIFELTLNGEGAVTQLDTITITNRIAKGTADFIKTDFDDDAIRLPGAVFSLYMRNTGTGGYELIQEDLATGENGQLVIPGLRVGNYRLVETRAPGGYHLREGQTVDFAIEQDERGEIKEFETMTIRNQRLASVRLIKQDAEDEALRLPGAVFTLWRYNSQTREYEQMGAGLTTDQNGELLVEGLEPGRYKLTETAAPQGYHLPEDPDIVFLLATDAEGWLIPLAPIAVSNRPLGRVRIVKVDEDDRTLVLEGAVFSLYLLDEKTGEYRLLRSGLTTGGDGVLEIDGLEEGAYKLVETQCPRGYVMPAIPEVTFVVEL